MTYSMISQFFVGYDPHISQQCAIVNIPWHSTLCIPLELKYQTRFTSGSVNNGCITNYFAQSDVLLWSLTCPGGHQIMTVPSVVIMRFRWFTPTMKAWRSLLRRPTAWFGVRVGLSSDSKSDLPNNTNRTCWIAFWNLKATRSPTCCKTQWKTRLLHKFYSTIRELKIIYPAILPLTVSIQPKTSQKIQQTSVKNKRSIKINKQKVHVLWFKQIQEFLQALSDPTNTFPSLTVKNQCKVTGSLRSNNVRDKKKVDFNRTCAQSLGNPWLRQMFVKQFQPDSASKLQTKVDVSRRK